MDGQVNLGNNFNPKVKYYLSKSLVSELFRKCGETTSIDRIMGFVLGETLVVDEKDYILATKAISHPDELENTNESLNIVGLFYKSFANDSPGTAMEVVQSMIQRTSEIQFIASVDANALEIKIMKKTGNLFISVGYIEVDAVQSPETISDILVEEVVELRTIRLNITYLSLAFFSLVFGILGGIISIIFIWKSSPKHGLILLMLGFLSSFGWLILGHSII
jgi:hypothetical protein